MTSSELTTLIDKCEKAETLEELRDVLADLLSDLRYDARIAEHGTKGRLEGT